MFERGASVTREQFNYACKRAGMERVQSCHDVPDGAEPFDGHHCRSDVWRGDMMIFALSLIEAKQTAGSGLEWD